MLSAPGAGLDGLLSFDLTAYIVYYVVTFLVSMVGYVITASALFTIAQRRGIAKPWMAWVPVGQLWLLGAISDHYQLVSKYNTSNNRKTLLWLQIVMLVLLVLALLLASDAMIQAQRVDNTASSYIDVWEHLVLDLKGLVVVGLLMFVAAVLTAGFEYVALFDLYRSCDPDNSVLYLVLSIFFGIAMPIFLLVVCDKDDGLSRLMLYRLAPK